MNRGDILKEEKQFNHDILEAIGIIIFMTIYALAGIYLFPFNLIFFPIPFIYLGVRRGLIQGILSLAVVSITVLIIVDIPSALVLILLFSPLVYNISEGIKSRRKSTEILGLSTAIFFLSVLLFYSVSQNITGINIMTQLEGSFNQMLDTQVEMFKEMGFTNFEILKTAGQLKGTYRYVLWVFPVITLISSLFISYCNYYLSIILLRRTGLGIVSIPRFSRFKLPNNTLLGVVVMFIASYIVKGLNLSFAEPLMLNIVTLIWTMFMAQGLSVLDFMFIKKGLKLPLRVFFLMVIMLILPLGTFIFFIGAMDNIFNFRKFNRSNA
ncbi:DUF2232 domain-containing protein [Tissierella creatinini]|nr:DUF2232 domain-containing protein [Tissierella creatinini]TJX62545.1 DUF2232 domain-containing protein [Soehngenia saccharolytica]